MCVLCAGQEEDDWSYHEHSQARCALILSGNEQCEAEFASACQDRSEASVSWRPQGNSLIDGYGRVVGYPDIWPPPTHYVRVAGHSARNHFVAASRAGLSCRQSCQSRNRNKKDYLAQNVAAKLRSTIPAPLERNLRPICSSRSIEEMPIQTAPIPAVRLSTRTQNHAVTSMWMSSWWMASAGCAG